MVRSRAMTGDQVTQPTFSCITIERVNWLIKRLNFIHNLTLRKKYWNRLSSFQWFCNSWTRDPIANI